MIYIIIKRKTLVIYSIIVNNKGHYISNTNNKKVSIPFQLIGGAYAVIKYQDNSTDFRNMGKLAGRKIKRRNKVVISNEVIVPSYGGGKHTYYHFIMYYVMTYYYYHEKYTVLIPYNLNNKEHKFLRINNIKYISGDNDWFLYKPLMLSEKVFPLVEPPKKIISTLNKINFIDYKYTSIYVIREGNRMCMNIDYEMLARHGIEAIKMSDYEIIEQAALFKFARLIISPHGAALVNLVFANDCSVIELIPNDWPSKDVFKTLCQKKGLSYKSVYGTNLSFNNSGFKIDNTELETEIRNILY